MNKTLTLGSLFDGSGGFPLGAVLNGITPVWASEIEPFPIRVTTKRFPEMMHLGDISKINGGEVEPVDIITFGSPCTDLSVAGKRAGLDGERSGLFMEQIRIVKEKRIAEEKRQKELRLKEQKELQEKYRQAGLCQHCGGTFKGLFSKTCVNCGTKKDY